jgi:AraC-like DNA-binding protein
MLTAEKGTVVDDLSFDSTDLSETQDFLVKAYTSLQISGHHPEPHTRIRRRWMGPVSVDELDFDFDMEFDVEPLGRICVCRIHSGSLDTRFGRVHDIFNPGDVAVLAPPNRPYSGQLRRTRYDATMLATAQLDRIAAAPSSQITRPVRLTGNRPISPRAGAHLSAFIDYLLDHVFVTACVDECELIADTGTQLLASLVLAAFPNTAQAESSPADHHDASTAAMRRAITFVDDNAHLPVSLADIASHVHMTPRGVQYLFRRHLDCTPMQYLRKVRLELAHRDLQRASPDGCAVAEVANRWGFAHPSRFAHYYRLTYGTSPQRTLKR